MKYKLINIVFLCILIDQSKADCTVDGKPVTSVPRELSFVDTEVLANLPIKFETEGVTGLAITSDIKIFEASLDSSSNELILKLSNDTVTDIDTIIDKQTGKTIQDFLILIINCSDGTTPTLSFNIYITDTNNHSPTFKCLDSCSITYNVPNPIPPLLDLTTLEKTQIEAYDLDFSNQMITFSVEDSSLKLNFITESNSNSKDYRAIVQFSEYTWLKQSEVVTIVAKDDDGKVSDNKFTIQFEIDETNSMPDVPKFDNLVYSFTYNGDQTNPQITGDKIIVTTETAGDITPSITPNPEMFNIEYISSTNEITLSLNQAITNINSQIMQYILTAEKSQDVTADAVILISVPADDVPSVPTFTEAYYKAKYIVNTETDTIELDKPISVNKYSSDVEVKVEDDPRFKTELLDETWKIVVETELTQDELDEGQSIIVKLSASNGDDSKTQSSLIIDLPSVTVLEFTSKTYYATYNIDNDGKPLVEYDNERIEVNGSPDGVEVNFVTANTNFKIVPTSYDIEVEKALDNIDLIKGEDIILPIQASLRKLSVGTSTLVIKIGNKSPTQIFTKILYNREYKIDGDNHFVTDEGEAIKTDPEKADGLSVSVVGTYANNFKTEQNSDGSYKINVIQHLEGELDTNSEIIVDLEASLTDIGTVGQAKINLKLPGKGTNLIPEFAEAYYKGTYIVNPSDTDTVKLDTEISVNNYSSDVEVVVEDDTRFKTSLNGEKWTITVATDLSQDELDEGQSIVVKLKASNTNGGSQSSFIIELPPVTVLEFTSKTYYATYNIDNDGKPLVEYDNERIEVNGSPDGVEVNFVTANTNFKIVPTSYNIEVEKALDNIDLIKGEDIILPIQASLRKLSVGTSTLVIKIGNKSPTQIFTKILYNREYKIDGDNHFVTDEGEAIKTDPEKADGLSVSVVGTYANNFKTEQNSDGSYKINVIQHLEGELDTNSEIIVDLEASLTDIGTVGQAKINLKLPGKGTNLIPEFTEAYYKGTYIVNPSDTDTVKLDTEISVNNYSSDVEVVVEVDTRFKTALNGEKWTITVATDLSQEELDKGQSIVVKLKASNTNGGSQSSLIIELPPVTVLEFTSKTYYATYNIDNDGKPLVEYNNGRIEVNGSPDGVEVNFVTANTNFKIVPTSYDIEVDKALDNIDLIKGEDIILPIQASLRKLSVGTSTLVIKIGNKAPTQIFTQILYNREYKIDGDNHFVTDEGEAITLDPKVNDLIVNVVGTYANNFKTEQNSDGSYKINVIQHLEGELDTNSEIIVDLEASLTDIGTVGQAKINLKLPGKASDLIPQFSEIGYRATYNHYKEDDQSDTVIVDSLKPIKIVSDQASETQVTVVSPSNFKAVSSSSGEWTLNVETKLDDDTLNTETRILVNLEAKHSDTLNVGRAVVVVDLPLNIDQTRPTPIFTETYYKSYIDDNGNLVVDGAEIAISGENEDITEVTVEDAYKSNILLNYKDKTWQISLGDPITSTDNQIAVKLIATLQNAVHTGAATLLVKLKDSDDPTVGKFDKAFYTCQYTVNSGTDTVSCDDIVVNGPFSEVKVAQEYETQFVLEKDTVDNKFNFKLKSNLPEETLKSETELIVAIEVIEGTAKNTATVIVNLPLKDNINPLQFEKLTYSATYSKSGTTGIVTLDDGPIKLITDDNEQGNVAVIENYTENFETKTDASGGWILSSKTGLDESILDDQISILLKLEGTTTTKKAYASVVVNLPKKTSQYSFNFNQNFYNADYENKNIVINDQIELDGDISGITLLLEGDFAEYLTASLSSNQIIINLAKPLPEEAEEKSSITIAIHATKDNEVVVAPLVINIKAPINNDDDDKGSNDTTFIIVIAILSVLLVVGIVGSSIFYYKRRNKITPIDQPEVSPRFTKNSNVSEGVKNEPIHRRPTGLTIGMPVDEDVDLIDLDTNNNFDGTDRRKSVVFDGVVEEMEIDRNDEDQTGDDDNESDDSSSTSSSSSSSNSSISDEEQPQKKPSITLVQQNSTEL